MSSNPESGSETTDPFKKIAAFHARTSDEAQEIERWIRENIDEADIVNWRPLPPATPPPYRAQALEDGSWKTFASGSKDKCESEVKMWISYGGGTPIRIGDKHGA